MKKKRYKLRFKIINLKNQKDCIIFKHMTYFSMGCLIASSLIGNLNGFIFGGVFSLSFLSLYWSYSHETIIYFEEIKK